ncbi:hypothetical protein [Mesorhizobium sp. M0674]|uniref:hypothetical protein n=1 Tax=unclassified Mesorhizobium TaxID=325217 RepID=UPI003336FDD0
MNDDSGPIKPPGSYPGRALARGTAEGLIELLPGASLATNIWAVTHPPADQKERQRWEQDITRRSNETTEQVRHVVSAFLRMQANNQRASEARRLSFLRGGMITTLEAITREGLTPALQVELRGKLETTASDVETLLEGLNAALEIMSADENNREFADILFEAVYGSFGKSSIRQDIDRLLRSANSSVDEQKRQADQICGSIDRFNHNLALLSNFAAGVGI